MITLFSRRTLLQSSAALTATAALGRAADKERPRMISRRIPGTEEELPVIGLGTWQTFDVGAGASERTPLREVLSLFSGSGARMVDSSPMYGRSEAVVGDLAAELSLRDKLFLATKVWTTGREEGIRQMNESMRRLRAPRLDLMQVHNLVDVDTHLDTLREWKAKGRVRYVGITHYTAGAHREVAEVIRRRPVDFLQINYSVGEREAERELLPLALERKIAVIANRPFGGGGLLRQLSGHRLPEWAAEIDCRSWAQLLLKFVVGHPAITCAIPATSKVEHLRDNLGAAEGRLPDVKLRERIASAATAS